MIQTSLVYLYLVSGHTCSSLSQPLNPNHIDMLIYGCWLSKSFSLLDSNLVSSRQLLRLSRLLVRNLNPLRLPPAVSNLGCSVTRFDFSWAGTENSDQARDFSLALKDRFYLQPLPPVEAAASAKESAKDIINVKSLIDKKAWPYVQNDLRLKAYLRYDLNTIISSKSKDKKKSLKDLTGKLFDIINNLDYAAKKKSTLDNLKAAVNSTRKLCVVCYSMLFFW